MVKKIISLYLALFLMFPATVFAEEDKPEYEVTSIKVGDPAPFDGVLLSLDAAAKIAVDKKFEDAECELRIGYELRLQEERFLLQLDYKDIELQSWKDRHESMMILKSAENARLEKMIIEQNPTREPWMVAVGFAIGTLSALGVFSLSTEIVK